MIRKLKQMWDNYNEKRFIKNLRHEFNRLGIDVSYLKDEELNDKIQCFPKLLDIGFTIEEIVNGFKRIKT